MKNAVDPQLWKSHVRVVSVTPGLISVVKFLGPIHGAFTHYTQKRSWACLGEFNCPSARHKEPRYWKGYACAELWCPEDKSWYPIVQEITAGLEERLRGICLRGQVWSLTRRRLPKKNTPVEALYLEQVQIETLREAYDFKDVLHRVYHGEDLIFGELNPARPKLVLGPTIAAAPKFYEPVVASKEQEKPATASDWKKLRSIAGMKETDNATSNGKATVGD